MRLIKFTDGIVIKYYSNIQGNERLVANVKEATSFDTMEEYNKIIVSIFCNKKNENIFEGLNRENLLITVI